MRSELLLLKNHAHASRLTPRPPPKCRRCGRARLPGACASPRHPCDEVPAPPGRPSGAHVPSRSPGSQSGSSLRAVPGMTSSKGLRPLSFSVAWDEDACGSSLSDVDCVLAHPIGVGLGREETWWWERGKDDEHKGLLGAWTSGHSTRKRAVITAKKTLDVRLPCPQPQGVPECRLAGEGEAETGPLNRHPSICLPPTDEHATLILPIRTGR